MLVRLGVDLQPLFEVLELVLLLFFHRLELVLLRIPVAMEVEDVWPTGILREELLFVGVPLDGSESWLKLACCLLSTGDRRVLIFWR